MKAITLEGWQVKSLRNYFGENDSTQTSHWAYQIFNKAKDLPESDPNEGMEMPCMSGILNQNKIMDKQIFKQGDRLYTHGSGWGTIASKEIGGLVVVAFDNGTITALEPTYLSFTEYTLNNFSQERPIDYNDYMGKCGVFWHTKDQGRLICTLEQYNEGNARPFVSKTWLDQFTHFKPLTEEQIKILELE